MQNELSNTTRAQDEVINSARELDYMDTTLNQFETLIGSLLEILEDLDNEIEENRKDHNDQVDELVRSIEALEDEVRCLR